MAKSSDACHLVLIDRIKASGYQRVNEPEADYGRSNGKIRDGLKVLGFSLIFNGFSDSRRQSGYKSEWWGVGAMEYWMQNPGHSDFALLYKNGRSTNCFRLFCSKDREN